ncbi:MAG: RdgB/HAM1 family non-canonical purine NTP pyrophosphatase [Alphaproteobacteria bacterium GM7ARS4]|nr:RdgB/HAM1 family non-canonical purine NTP pyrophosphatase [Alphaproteobacteria bacterium GM7ARS4]
MIKNIVIASHNIGKVIEIRQFLMSQRIDVLSLKDLDIPEPEENASSFEGNAALKAQHAFSACAMPCLADDSGLEVACLQGRPGIYSARYALHPSTQKRDFAYAMQKLHKDMGDSKNRKARFVCALAWVTPQQQKTQFFVATIEGTLCWPPKGKKGFGYDPMFIPQGSHKTFAEMEVAEKQPLSHRQRALRLWHDAVFS